MNENDIVEILKSYMSELSGDVNCVYFDRIAKAIMDKIKEGRRSYKDVKLSMGDNRKE